MKNEFPLRQDAVTMDDILEVIKSQGLGPSDLFTRSELVAWRDADAYGEEVRAKARSDIEAAAAAAEAANDKPNPKPNDKSGAEHKAEDNPRLSPATNPLIKVG